MGLRRKGWSTHSEEDQRHNGSGLRLLADRLDGAARHARKDARDGCFRGFVPELCERVREVVREDAEPQWEEWLICGEEAQAICDRGEREVVDRSVLDNSNIKVSLMSC